MRPPKGETRMTTESRTRKESNRESPEGAKPIPPLPDITIDEKFKTDLLERALKRAFLALEGHDDFKISIADLIRLLEAHSEMKSETTREVVVRWVEENEAKPETDQEGRS